MAAGDVRFLIGPHVSALEAKNKKNFLSKNDWFSPPLFEGLGVKIFSFGNFSVDEIFLTIFVQDFKSLAYLEVGKHLYYLWMSYT